MRRLKWGLIRRLVASGSRSEWAVEGRREVAYKRSFTF